MLLKKKRIPFSYCIITKNTLESFEDLKETFDFLMSLPRPFNLNLNPLYLYPKTDITKTFERLAGKNELSGIFAKDVIPEKDKRKIFFEILLYLYSIPFVPKVIVKAISKLTFLGRFRGLFEKLDPKLSYFSKIMRSYKMSGVLAFKFARL
jgi:hypothetical protein